MSRIIASWCLAAFAVVASPIPQKKIDAVMTAEVQPEVIESISSISDPGAVRRRIRLDDNNPALDLFRDAVGLLKALDRKSHESETPSQQQVLGGYTAIRAVHGIVIENNWPLVLDRKFEPAERREREWLTRHVQCPVAAAGADKDSMCGIWNRCVHARGVIDPESVDFPIFLLWHRAYVRAFELSLRNALRNSDDPEHRKKADDFGIPYWPWLDADSRLLPKAFAEGYQADCDYSRSDQYPLLDCFRSKAIQQRTKPVWDATKTLNPFEIDDVDWASFSGTLEEGWHNAIHTGIARDDGMDMGISMLAVRDPVFWVHHAFIDLLMTHWARENLKGVHSELLTGLRAAWNEKNFQFPVATREGIRWYKPSFDSLDVESANPMGYSFDEYAIPAEGIGNRTIDYVFIEPNRAFTSLAEKKSESSKEKPMLGGQWVTRTFKPRSNSAKDFSVGMAPAHISIPLDGDDIKSMQRWKLWEVQDAAVARRRVLLQLDKPVKDTIMFADIEKFDLFVAPQLKNEKVLCAAPVFVGSFGWFGIASGAAEHHGQDADGGHGKVVDITKALVKNFRDSIASKTKGCKGWLESPALTLIIYPRLRDDAALGEKQKQSTSLTFPSLTLLVRTRK